MRHIIAILTLTACAFNAPHSNIGAQYLGAPYVLDPLGEGIAPDTDPLIRFDAFDCTTFVETSLAGGEIDRLNKIRYRDGKISFENRNHFIETDWLNNNSDMVRNVSAAYGRTATRRVTIDRAGWMRTVHNMDSDDAPQTVDLEYIPYANVATINTSDTLIVLFIAGNFEKSDKIGTDLAVRHMGFLMPNGMLRHASSKHGRVVDECFAEYITQRQRNKNNLGIILLEIK